MLLLLLLFVVAFFTNPNENFHKTNIKQRVYQELNIDTTQRETNNLIDLFTTFGNSFGKSMVDKTVNNLLTVDNYYFFSLTRVSYQDENKIIGIGAFNHIFLFVNLEQLVKEQQKQQTIIPLK